MPSLKAGLSISLTGRFSEQGCQALRAIQLWADRAKANLVYYDDQSRARLTAENTLRLIERHAVDILFSPYSSRLTLAAARVAEERRKVLWNFGGTSDEIFNQGFHYLVGIPSPASDYLRTLPECLRQNSPELKNIVLFHSAKGNFAVHVARGLRDESVGFELRVFPFEKAIENPLSLIGDVEILAVVASFEDEIALLLQRPTFPSSIREIVAVAAGVNSFYGRLGALAEGIIGPSQWESGLESNSFTAQFRKRVNQEPTYVAAGAFAAGLVVEECIRRSGSLQDEQLRRTAAELDFETFYGRFRIDPLTGKQLAHQMKLRRWSNGKPVVIWPRN